jgi:SAM-dependent methyltransferase
MEDKRVLQSSPSYWNSKVEAFDSIYSGNGWSKLHVLISNLLRKEMFERVEECVAIAKEYHRPISILDLGCGTGRLIRAAYPTGSFIVGVDYSSNMLEKASRVLAESRVPGNSYALILGDIVNDWPKELDGYERFEVVAMLGLVEYISDPLPLLRKMMRFSPDKIIVSFCRAHCFRRYLRQARYRVQGLECPLFFHTREDIMGFGKELGAKRTEIKILGSHFFAVFSF